MSADPSPIRPDLAEALLTGGALSDADVTALCRLPDILRLGGLADEVRRARHGTTTTYLRVHALDLGTTTSWTVPPPGTGEMQLTGAPSSAAAAVAAVAAARALAADVPLRGFDLADLVALDDVSIYRALRQAGLDAVALAEPGPGAAAAVVAARAAGLVVDVVGALAPPVDRAAWLLDVRALQAEVGGFVAVAPLPRTADPTTPTTGFDDVRAVAVTRLALDTVPHVQVDWRRHGPKLAQVALTVGADDIDGVAAADDVSRGPRRAPVEEIRRNIAAAGLTPSERDAGFAARA